jgi:hypothetical protein
MEDSASDFFADLLLESTHQLPLLADGGLLLRELSPQSNDGFVSTGLNFGDHLLELTRSSLEKGGTDSQLASRARRGSWTNFVLLGACAARDEVALEFLDPCRYCRDFGLLISGSFLPAFVEKRFRM